MFMNNEENLTFNLYTCQGLWSSYKFILNMLWFLKF